MAINDDTQTQQSTAQAPRAEQQRSGGSATTQPMSFHGGVLFGAPISRTVGSEVYSKLRSALEETYKQTTEDVEIALIDLDNVNEPALAFSAIVVALRMKNEPKLGVAYHVLVLEATGDKPAPIYENINGQQIEILRVTSDAMDDVLMKKAEEKVRRAFPSSSDWFNVDGTVIPANFNPDDKYAVHQLALNAGLACSTELTVRKKGFQDLNLATLPNDSSLNVNITFNRTQIADAVGNPMRSDILISFGSKRNTQGGKYASMNSGDKEVKVSEVSGFVDLVWNSMQSSSPYAVWNQQQQAVPTQKYAARMILTDLKSNMAYTPASVLLSLATSLTVREENNWIQTFRPMAPVSNEIDMTDIGALNIEANLLNDPSGYGTRIDTKSDSFKLTDLGQLVAALIQPGLIVSLDCPEFGPQAWYLSPFAAGAHGNVNAQRIIFDAANNLTGGAFAKHFPQGAPMFVDAGNRVHAGTWTDRHGNKRDIREIDLLAVCNLAGDRNPQAIRDWSDTFLKTQFPLAQRLAARKRMISSLTNETAVFTGFYQRVTFSAAFMGAFSEALRETGMAVRVNTPLTGADLNNQRGVAGFAQAALVAPGQTFANNGGFGGYQPQFNFGMGGQNFRY